MLLVSKYLRNLYFIWLLLAIPWLSVSAQERNILFKVEASGGYISPGKMPFWFRSNRFGSIPIDNASASLAGSVHKEFDTVKRHIFDWGGAVEARVNIGQKSNFNLIEGYGKIRISVLEIKAGRSKDIMGLGDASLSSGSFSVSGNAPGIPKIEIGIPDFYIVPVFNRLFAIKFNYVHGWLGETPVSYKENTGREKTYLHQKSLYVRLGRPDWKYKLYGGFNHQVFWGNEKNIFGNEFPLSGFQTYLYVITAKKYSTNTIKPSRIGNHIGSVDLGFEYKFEKVSLLIYRQNFYDYIALKYLANLKDGLNGLCLINKDQSGNLIQLKKVLIEFLYSKDQGKGFTTPDDPAFTYEDYYNNYIYPDGWSYRGIGLGSPFLTSETFMREELSANANEYFNNNRVMAFHVGMEGSIKLWNYVIKTSYSKNYGTYSISLPGNPDQLSTYLEGNRELKNGLNVGFITAFDTGELYYNSFGLLLRISKSF